MKREMEALHLAFSCIATLLVFWIARVTMPIWMAVPAVGIILLAPKLQRAKLIWEAVIAVGLAAIAATNGQRLAMGYADRYREILFLLVPVLLYAGIVRTRLKPPGEPQYLSGVILLGLLSIPDVTGAPVTIAVLSLLVLLALLLGSTTADRPRLMHRLVPVALLLVIVTLFAVVLPVETGPFSESAAQGLQEYLFGNPTASDAIRPRYPTKWFKPWPPAPSYLAGSWLMREAFAGQVRALAVPLLTVPVLLLLSWIFIGATLQQGPGKSLRRLVPALVIEACICVLLAVLTILDARSLNTLMYGPTSPWFVNGKMYMPDSWNMFLGLRASVRLFPSDTVMALQLAVRNLAILASLLCIATCVRQALATKWNALEGIGGRRERIRIERTIRRIRGLGDDELLHDPRGTVIAIFYMAANALYPLNLAMERGETPTELARRSAVWYPDIAVLIERLARSYYVARYSTDDVSPEQVMACRATYQEILEILKEESIHPRIRAEGAEALF